VADIGEGRGQKKAVVTPPTQSSVNGQRRDAPARKLESPQDFYRRLAARPDVSKILERLAK
jgi:hypothetical protein